MSHHLYGAARAAAAGEAAREAAERGLGVSRGDRIQCTLVLCGAVLASSRPFYVTNELATFEDRSTCLYVTFADGSTARIYQLSTGAISSVSYMYPLGRLVDLPTADVEVQVVHIAAVRTFNYYGRTPGDQLSHRGPRPAVEKSSSGCGIM